MKRRDVILLIGALVVAALLAVLLHDIVRDRVITPLVLLAWKVKVLYHAIPQVLYWILLIAILILLISHSLRTSVVERQRFQDVRPSRTGEIQQLSSWLQRSRRSIYSKWWVAHMLAELALQAIRVHRGKADGTKQLEDPGWNPPLEVKEYLDAAFRTTYSDYSRSKASSSPHVSFDRYLEPTVKYLESFLESDNDHQHS